MNGILEKLPEICYSRNAVDGKLIIIKRGESGYYPCDYEGDVDELNNRLEVNKAQVSAMKMGSMFGWNVLGANPDMYDEEGKPKPKK